MRGFVLVQVTLVAGPSIKDIRIRGKLLGNIVATVQRYAVPVRGRPVTHVTSRQHTRARAREWCFLQNASMLYTLY